MIHTLQVQSRCPGVMYPCLLKKLHTASTRVRAPGQTNPTTAIHPISICTWSSCGTQCPAVPLGLSFFPLLSLQSPFLLPVSSDFLSLDRPFTQFVDSSNGTSVTGFVSLSLLTFVSFRSSCCAIVATPQRPNHHSFSCASRDSADSDLFLPTNRPIN